MGDRDARRLEREERRKRVQEKLNTTLEELDKRKKDRDAKKKALEEELAKLDVERDKLRVEREKLTDGRSKDKSVRAVLVVYFVCNGEAWLTGDHVVLQKLEKRLQDLDAEKGRLEKEKAARQAQAEAKSKAKAATPEPEEEEEDEEVEADEEGTCVVLVMWLCAQYRDLIRWSFVRAEIEGEVLSVYVNVNVRCTWLLWRVRTVVFARVCSRARKTCLRCCVA